MSFHGGEVRWVVDSAGGRWLQVPKRDLGGFRPVEVGSAWDLDYAYLCGSDVDSFLLVVGGLRNARGRFVADVPTDVCRGLAFVRSLSSCV